MAKAVKKISTTETECAALKIARLIGACDEQNNQFQGMDSRRRRSGGSIFVNFGGAALDAHRMARLASKALALAPANSLGGALAKIIVAISELEQEIDELETPENRYRTETALFQSRLLMEDAISFIGQAYGVTPESIGLHQTYNRYLEPRTKMSAAEEAAKALPAEV